ncbi:MAG: flagellar basal-body MS-ring/collar protein FliF [Candidatus Marinimicrobia bacterium]|nr:flagellar basal-body MS-ring/collar protein FliF [Candidatus Neomarinimicrobiota bacterium]
MTQLFNLIGTIFRRYSPAQRAVLAVVFVLLFSITISLVLWANRPEFVILYSDMDSKNASKILAELQGSKVRYEIEDNGATILVPKEKASELRLRFIEAGYVGQVVSGYELFDDQKLGMTSFMQQLNMRRALEGELTKTINQFPGVMNSRIHLVIPEGKLFEKGEDASASIVISLAPGRFIGESQVKGIAALVANSVEGLNSDAVVVVDTDGNLLTSGQGEEMVMGASGSQWDLRHNIERKLEKKIEHLLEGVVGPQNAMVEVSVEMNFEKLERTQELFDPENVVVVSEERHSESSVNLDTTNNINNSNENENVVTNYELNKTVEHYVANTGVVIRQTVAVLINGTYQDGEDPAGKKIREYVPRSKQEVAQIKTLVQSAVGYSEDRGDVIEVQNIQFDKSMIEEDKVYFESIAQKEMQASLINKGLMALGLLVAFFVVRGLLKSVSNEIELPVLLGGSTEQTMLQGSNVVQGLPQQGQATDPTIVGSQSAPEPTVNYDSDAFMAKLSLEAQAKLKAKDKMTSEVVEYSKENPEDTAKLLRTWMAPTVGSK